MSASAAQATNDAKIGKACLTTLDDKEMVAKRADELSDKSADSLLSTKQNISNLIDEIETISKEMIIQTLNSNKARLPNESPSELAELTKILIQKQDKLTHYLNIASEQQVLHKKINKIKEALVEVDADIKSLILYLKEAEQVLSSAVYQSRIKLEMINKAKKLPSELIIRYAHKISAGFGVCCPENWTLDQPLRPYPTDVDMRNGWLARIGGPNSELGINPEDVTAGASASATVSGTDQQNSSIHKTLMRSNSKIIDPIVPQQEFGFNKDKYASNSAELMSDSSDSLSDNDSPIMT